MQLAVRMKFPMMMALLVLTPWIVLAQDQDAGIFDEEDQVVEEWCQTQVEEKTDCVGEFKDHVILFCRAIIFELHKTTCEDLLEENRTHNVETSPYLIAFNVIYDDICPDNMAQQAQHCGRDPALKKAIAQMRMEGMGRITGGHPVDNCSVVPWQVRVDIHVETGNFLCGGSIISNRHILTAAHCLYEVRDLADVTVILGEFDLNRDDPYEQWIPIREMNIHPDYDNETYVADLAILTLRGAILFDNDCMKIICRNPYFHFDGESCFVSGWGSEVVDEQGSSILKVAMVLTHEGPNCDRVFEIDDPSYVSAKEKMICAGHPDGGVDSCTGDSGGALVCLDVETDVFVQVGIVSFGEEECGLANRPGGYTNVAYFNEWINQLIN